MAYVCEQYFYDLQRHNYLEGILVRKQINEKTFEMSDDIEEGIYEEQLRTTIRKTSFAENMKRYCESKSGNGLWGIIGDMIARQYPEVKAYYEELGADRIKALGYKEVTLKNEIRSKEKTNQIIYEFRKIFKSGERYVTDEIKSMMRAVYDRLGIKKTPVVTNLEKEYGIRIHPCKVTINEKRVSGYCFL